jgi:DNA modification methylase
MKFENQLYYGDNLDILRRHIKDETVDLVYLDPPFKSSRDYNILFEERNGTGSKAQIKAFEDTWYWNQEAEEAYLEIVESGHTRVSQAMQAFRTFLGESDMMAYMAMMAPRLVELKRVLKPSGSIYLHCDPTASHYLKMLMDAVFGAICFRNEIVWRRTPFSGSSKARAKQLPRSHDSLLFYSKGESWTWEPPTEPYSEDYIKRFKWKDKRGYYRKTLLKTYSEKTLNRLRREDRLIEPTKPGAMYSYKQYLEESSGERQIDDIWCDINMINPVAKERLGYPTQKPEALLERILKASSNKGDIILDPFCGCGTTIAVAQKLERKWIGIDITHIAIALIKHRLEDMFGGKAEYNTLGEPVTTSGAKELAGEDPYQFQWWALGLVGARPVEQKKGADKGIDGRIFFHEGRGDTKQIIFSVKAGKVSVAHIRDLRGVVEREKAQIGVFLTMNKPTKQMIAEAASAGIYKSPWGKHPVIQILAIEEILKGKPVDYPRVAGTDRTFKKAQKVENDNGEPQDLDFQ